jgi:2-polyprenyl-3-methyl-5-hydroxy-6-metoxy-1,4-benzoquinol methylase
MIQAPRKCRICGNEKLSILIDLGNQPIAHRLLEQPEKEFTHPLRLHSCDQCGLNQIIDPIDPEVLYKGYNYCFSSWKPEPHRETELKLINSHKNHSKVFEIGCNDGLFLEELKKRGQDLCVGLEPNTFAARIARETRGLKVYETFLDEKTVEEIKKTFGLFDVILARQVLEHVADIDLFFGTVDKLLAADGVLFIDVPDVGRGLQVGDCTIVWEEHVNYFTEDVLLRTLNRFGFHPLAFEKYNYSGGTLAVLASRNSSAATNDQVHDFRPYAKTFNARVQEYRDRLIKVLAGAKKSFDQIVIYGVGCRACTFVNGLGLAGLIDFAVDDQPERQKKLMPGSQLQIREPTVLQKPGMRSLVLLAVNQENEDKVKTKTLAACQNSKVAFLSIFGPTDIENELTRFAKSIE